MSNFIDNKTNASSFGDSFIGTKLTINGQNWEVVGSEPGDSMAEDDCFLHLQNENGETAHIHYQDYDEGDILGQYPGDPLAGNKIEYPDGEPESVRVRRQKI